MLGMPGSGKGTQSNLLKEKLNFYNFSMGDFIRKEISDKSELGSKCVDATSKGELVSDDIIFSIIEKNFSFLLDKNVIFDGFPRNKAQANFIDSLLNKYNKKFDYVFYINISEEAVINRITSRYSCKKCKAVFNKTIDKDLSVCKNCDSNDFETRDDDKYDVIINRLKEYKKETHPLVDHYSSILKNSFYNIEGERDSQLIYNDLLEIINNK